MENYPSKRKKINFVYDIDNNIYWQDGLRAAMSLMEIEYNVSYSNVGIDEPLTKADVYIAWGGFTSKAASAIQNVPGKKILLYAGGLIYPSEVKNYDNILVEDEWTVNQFKRGGVSTILAFGTDTQLFKPMSLPKVWDVMYPAAFASWKRHDKFLEYANGKRALAVGYIQPNNVDREGYNACLEAGIDVLPRVTAEVLVSLYNMSSEIVVTADEIGGGQRTILEALACNVPINKDLLNDRLLSVYNKGLLTELDYYKAIKKGVDELWTM